MSEPTDPLAELRRLVNTATLGEPFADDEEHTDYIAAFERMADVADRALRYLTSPEAEVEIERVLLKPQSHAAQALAVLRFIAEKAVTR